MSPKTIKTLIVIFFGLLLIILEINWLEKSSTNNTSLKTDFNMEKIDGKKVEKIIISKGDEKKELVRGEDQWTLGDKKVSETEIGEFFGALGTAKVLEVASKNKNNQNNFGLAEEQVYVLEIIDGSKNEKKFLIGKAGVKSNSFYAKKEGSDNVYLIGGALLAKITQAEDDWLEKEKTESAEALIDENSPAEEKQQ